MRLLVISDIDALQWEYGTGQADVLLSCGDVFDQVILGAAQAYGCSTVGAVKGNHDSSSPFPTPIMDLHLRVWEFRGIRFGGLNGAWRYKARGAFLYEQSEAAALLERLPAVDVLVCHNSPRDVHDSDYGIHCGFEALNKYIERNRPQLVIHGHQHVNRESRIGATRVVGVYGHRLLTRMNQSPGRRQRKANGE